MAWTIDLSGKSALVTGGSRGIGAECCRQLAIAGADIVFSYLKDSPKEEERAYALEEELHGLGVKVLGVVSDVSSESEVQSLAAVALREFGKVDILVCNAGILRSSCFEELEYSVWKKMMTVILDGAYLCARAVVPSMLEQHYGKIIFISSNTSINGGGGCAAYPAAKAGMIALARQLAKEYGVNGICANAVSPAVVDTEMFRLRYSTDEMVAEYGKSMPVGRVGKPEDIANAVVFLASDQASYICGHNLLVDGGRTYLGMAKP